MRFARGGMQSTWTHTALFALLVFLSGISFSTACNKALCASDVSKCLIQVTVLPFCLLFMV